MRRALPLIILLMSVACTKEADPQIEVKPINTSEKSLSKGIGPVDHVDVGALNGDLAAKGKTIFEGRCVACHKINEKYVGPALKGVTKRREPEWIMNMILNPSEMTQKDPVAKALLAEHLTQMANTSSTQEEARALLEYLRSID
jgi:mono/diheme cytochrome c family protein